MLTVAQLEAKQFSVVRFGKAGYEQESVDDFLDEVAVSYRNLWQRAEAAEARLHTFQNTAQTQRIQQTAPQPIVPPVVGPPVVGPPVDAPSVASVALLLKSAEQAADDLVAEAHRQADQVQAVAKAEAARIVASGHTERHAAIGALEEKRAELAAKVDALRGVHSETVAKLQEALNSLTVVEGDAG